MDLSHSSRCLASSSLHQALRTAAVLAALAVPAAAQLQFDALPRKGLPAVTYDTQSVALGDVDGDGDLDMVIGNNNQQNRLYRNDGAGTFSDATAGRMPVDNDSTKSVALGDVDGDGDLDMVLGNSVIPGGQQNRLYLNDGTGTFSDATAGRMPVFIGNTRSVALGDVDGDGDLDMVLGNDWQGQQNRLYRNDGTGTFSDVTAGQMPVDTDWTISVALGDVDADGDLDMVLGNGFSGQRTRLYLNNGAGTFSDATAGRMPVCFTTFSVALGDVDGDGDLDIVLGTLQQQNRLFLNDGAGTFADATAVRMPVLNDRTFSVALGDVDGDGDLDMVVGNALLFGLFGQTLLYLNDGTGTFTNATAVKMPVDNDETAAVALGDVDGDGDLDMVIGNTGQPNRIYHNLQRQLHAPTAPQLGQPYSLDAYLRYGPPSAVDLAAIFLSLASASIPTPIGTLRIDPLQSAPFPLLTIPQPAGVGQVSLAVPNAPALIGLELYSQAVLVAYPNDLRLSNVVVDVIQ